MTFSCWFFFGLARCLKNAEHSVKAENSIENSAPTMIPSATGLSSTGFLSPWVPDSSRFMTMTCAAVILGFVMGPWWASQNHWICQKLSNQKSYAMIPDFNDLRFLGVGRDKTCRTTKPRAQLHRKASLVQVIPWVPSPSDWDKKPLTWPWWPLQSPWSSYVQLIHADTAMKMGLGALTIALRCRCEHLLPASLVQPLQCNRRSERLPSLIWKKTESVQWFQRKKGPISMILQSRFNS